MTSGKAMIGKGASTTENRSRSRSPKNRRGNKSSISHLKMLDDLIEVEIEKKVGQTFSQRSQTAFRMRNDKNKMMHKRGSLGSALTRDNVSS